MVKGVAREGEEIGQQKLGLRRAKYFRTWNWLERVAVGKRETQRQKQEGRENFVLRDTQTSAGSSS